MGACLSAYVALLCGFQVAVQAGLAEAWVHQRTFWRRLVEVVPDLHDGTIILCDLDGWARSRYMQTVDWASPYVLESVFTFPPSWKQPPEVIHRRFQPVRLSDDGATIYFQPVPGESGERARAVRDLVAVEPGPDGYPTRVRGNFEVDGRRVPVRPLAPGPYPVFAPGPLHPYVFGPAAPQTAASRRGVSRVNGGVVEPAS